jgi:hypothetical protein
MAMNIDLLPTLVRWAGRQAPDVDLDGLDIASLLTVPRAPSPHDELLLFINEDIAAIRTQRWKYVVRSHYRTFDAQLDLPGRPDWPVLVDMAKNKMVTLVGLNYKEVRGDGAMREGDAEGLVGTEVSREGRDAGSSARGGIAPVHGGKMLGADDAGAPQRLQSAAESLGIQAQHKNGQRRLKHGPPLFSECEDARS